MVELWKPRLVLSGLTEQEQASSECFLEQNRVALFEIFVWCVPFLKTKVLPFGCSPRASCYLVQGAGGSCHEIALILHWNVPKHVPGFFVKKNSDIARSSFFLSWVLEIVLSWKSLSSDVRFFEEKSALTECSPRASCYLEQGAGGS